MTSWRDHISEHGYGNGSLTPDEKAQVMEALEDPRWDFRTVAGIARDTGLSDESVEAALEWAHGENLVRTSNAPGPHGTLLYALAERPVTRREWLAGAQAIISRAA